MKIKPNQKGFTLVEVIIVIAIVGILSAVALPAILDTLPRYRLRAEARELVINFKKAKVEAVKHNRDVVILFTDAPVASAGGSYQMFVNVDGNTPPTLDAGDIALVGSPQLEKNIRLESLFPNDWAGFNSRGLPVQNNIGTVNVEANDGSRSYAIILSTAGNVRLQ